LDGDGLTVATVVSATTGGIAGTDVLAALAAYGQQLNATDPDDDLVGGMTDMLTCSCARLYGKRRSAEERAARIKAEAAAAEPTSAGRG